MKEREREREREREVFVYMVECCVYPVLILAIFDDGEWKVSSPRRADRYVFRTWYVHHLDPGCRMGCYQGVQDLVPLRPE